MSKWEQVSYGAGRNDLPRIAVQEWWNLPVHERPTALMLAWSLSEFPEKLAPQSVWSEMFRNAADDDGNTYLADGEIVSRSEDLAALTMRDDRIRLYRGAIPDRRFGMSWTGELERAEWFARRFNGISDDEGGEVWSLDVPVEYVLAHITGRSEDEYVLDVAYLEDPVKVARG